jgi:hypothetical protein
MKYLNKYVKFHEKEGTLVFNERVLRACTHDWNLSSSSYGREIKGKTL